MWRGSIPRTRDWWVHPFAGESGLWRYRVGDYRMLVSIHDDELLVLVVSVDHRRQVYRDL
jgi:mRNA interferase RelE/StbE